MFTGVILLLCASLTFALSTVFVKFATSAPYFVSPALATFARFFIGFLMFSTTLASSGVSLKPNNPRTVAVRAVLNTVAVILFFMGIKHTTVTNANILNLTYPAFVFLIAPFMTGEKQVMRDYAYLAATLAGAALIVLGGGDSVSFSSVNLGDVFALGSGIVAAFAISGLREATKYDSAHVILFYQMAFGTLATLVLVIPSFQLPHGRALVYVLIAAVLANLGQFFITRGYSFISAALGSVVLESGIFFAAVLGITIFNDPLTPAIVLGGVLILLSIAGISRASVDTLAKTNRK
jgi:EamA-like transporter family.